MGNNTHIEINGKRYDARTGQLLDNTAQPTAPEQPLRKSRGEVVEVRAAGVHKTTQRSQTLMRHAVKKPAAAKHVRAQSRGVMADVAPKKQSGTARVDLYHTTNPQRQARASHIARSTLVTRFNHSPHAAIDRPVTTKVVALPVAKEPSAPAAALARPMSAAASVLEKGLANAQSHIQPLHQLAPARSKRRRRLVSFAASSFAVLLLAGFITYQNIPNISMRYAASRAGVSARMPDYQPAGFSLNKKIQYNPGQITLSFRSNTDERSFTITQRESSWNSETLRTNYIAADMPVQTFEDKGRTIYLYGDSNATWVNGGVWYEIKGDSLLNSDQLIRIATSM